MKFVFQMDWNFIVDLRQTHLTLKLKMDELCFGKLQYQRREKKAQESNEAEEAGETQDEQNAPVPLFTFVNNILYSLFPTVEVYIINQ